MKKIASLNNFLLLVIFCTPLYLIRVSVFGLPSNLFELLAIIALILIAFKEKTFLLRQLFELPKLLLYGSTFLLVGLLISIFFNNNHLAGLGILKGWFLIPMFFSFAIFLFLLKSKLDIEKIFWSLYLSTVAVGIISIAYKFFGITTYDNRLTAFYLSPNHLAMYLAPGIFLGAYFMLKAVRQQHHFGHLLVHAFMLLALIFPLYYTYSYGAWVAIILSVLVMILISSGSKKNIFALMLIILIFSVGLFYLQINTDKFSKLTEFSTRSSFASRQTIWQASFLMIKNSPILGIGPGNFQQSYLSLQSNFKPYLEWAVPQPHNIFLAFWLQAGVLGLIGFLMMLLFIFQTLWREIKNKKNIALAMPLFGFFLYTILHGLIDTTYWKNDLALLFWLFIFMVLSVHLKSSKNIYNSTR